MSHKQILEWQAIDHDYKNVITSGWCHKQTEEYNCNCVGGKVLRVCTYKEGKSTSFRRTLGCCGLKYQGQK